MRKTNDAWEILMADIAGDKERMDGVRQSCIQAEAGIVAYDLREKAGLTQEQLAQKLNVAPAVIDDVEMGDFEAGKLVGDAAKDVCRMLGAKRSMP